VGDPLTAPLTDGRHTGMEDFEHDERQPDAADDVADLLPAYALGVLSPAERARVEAHLARDPASRQELAGFATVVAHLPLLAEERDPPARLRQRLIAAATELVTPPAPAGSHGVLHWQRRPRPAVLAASVLLLVSLGLAGWNVALQGQLADQQRLAGQLRTQIAALQAQPRVTIYTIGGTPAAPNARGEVVYLGEQHTAFLTVQNLPAPPAGRAYQVWYIQDGRPIDAGLLAAPGDQVATRLQADLGQYQALAVSLEPSGGSPQPTGPIVLQAPLQPGNA
jgi:anti-sigma-K factor RskA